MADSAQARFSTFEVPGLMMTPFPHGADSAADRSQLNDLYAGIAGQIPASTAETCWTNVGQASSPWVNASRAGGIWSRESGNNKTWKPEKEVVPC